MVTTLMARQTCSKRVTTTARQPQVAEAITSEVSQRLNCCCTETATQINSGWCKHPF